VPLDITILPPVGTYGQILSRSGLLAKQHVDVKPVTIDQDYTGNIQVLLENNGDKPFSIAIGDRIAQLVLLRFATPKVSEVEAIKDTARGANGFGGPGISSPVFEHPCIRTTVAASDIEKPYDIFFSHDPFDNILEVEVAVRGNHPTLGILSQYCPYRQRLQIKDMALSTPGSRIKKWRSTLRNAYILKVQEYAVANEQDMEHAVKQVRQRQLIKIKLVVATDKSYGVHPIEGIMQIYFDQMNVIAKHLEELAAERRVGNNEGNIRMVHETPTTDPTSTMPVQIPPPPKPPPPTMSDTLDEQVAESFTKKQLLKRADWNEWEMGQYTQLDQYWSQGMFSNPMPLPKNSNALRMLWRFNLKACGTKKSRMVCNGSPAQKGTVTLGHTYANALDAASERLFWAIVANEGLIAIGADVSNAFAEAPAPKAPLFLYIDDTFREWWVRHLGKEPIPQECNAVRVHNAIQGHPESPRLWEKHIDTILKDLGLTPTTHEPCLYSGHVQGKRVLFLRQVDDFAVASTDRKCAEQLIDDINNKMRIQVKHLGIIDRFNGMDIHQTRDYVKLTCTKYLQKVIKNHRTLLTEPVNILPVPLHADSNFTKQLEQAPLPNTMEDKLRLKQQMGFNYRKIIGEVIYPMMKCRPEIAAAAIKLSQYMDNPADIHYKALLGLLHFLSTTIDDGIYYWRRKPRMDLPEAPMPTIAPDNYYLDDNTPNTDHHLYGYVDSDWGTDSVHRKSITGIVLLFAGGAVGYRCKYQDVIAHSSTEAEFTAACDAGKMILFFRSLLDELGIEQTQATILFEDNNGALMMANAQQPTRRTRHMDIKKFALLDWVEQDLMILKTIKTAENAADGMTKPLGKQLFYRHAATIMGKRVPQYVLRSNMSIRPDMFVGFDFSTPTNMGGG